MEWLGQWLCFLLYLVTLSKCTGFNCCLLSGFISYLYLIHQNSPKLLSQILTIFQTLLLQYSINTSNLLCIKLNLSLSFPFSFSNLVLLLLFFYLGIISLKFFPFIFSLPLLFHKYNIQLFDQTTYFLSQSSFGFHSVLVQHENWVVGGKSHPRCLILHLCLHLRPELDSNGVNQAAASKGSSS